MTTLKPHHLNIDHVGREADVTVDGQVISGRLGKFEHDIDWYEERFVLSNKVAHVSPSSVFTRFSVGSFQLSTHLGSDITINLKEKK